MGRGKGRRVEVKFWIVFRAMLICIIHVTTTFVTTDEAKSAQFEVGVPRADWPPKALI